MKPDNAKTYDTQDCDDPRGTAPATASADTHAVTTLDAARLQQVIEENLGSGGLELSQLDQVRVGLGGTTQFAVPSPEGETQQKEIAGVILHAQDVRRFWPLGLEESGGNTPPACSSDDALVGIGTPGGACPTCPHASFLDGPPRCKQQRLLLFLRPTDVLPLVVVVPPSSLAVLTKYFVRLTSQGLPFSSVVTELTLERARSGGGIVYSRIVARLCARLSPEQAARVQACAHVLRSVIRPSSHRSRAA